MATVHLVCGPVGAGKTTYARRLGRELRAVRFSLDEWVMALFGRNMPEPLNLAWWMEHCELCSAQIWRACRELLATEIDVILDFGLGRREWREKYRELARGAGALVKLHVVDAEPSVRRVRVQQRNNARGETYALRVTTPMFDGSEDWWEPPTPDELEC